MTMAPFSNTSEGNILCELRDSLKLIADGTKVSHHDSMLNEQVATDDFGNGIVLPGGARRLWVILYNRDVVFARASEAQGNYDSPNGVRLIAPGVWPFEVYTEKIAIRNAVAGMPATYSLVMFD